MSSIDAAIEKLLRRIQRAASKNKWNKVERLTKQLNELQDVAEQQEIAEQQETLDLPSHVDNHGSDENSEEEEDEGEIIEDDNYLHEVEERDIQHGH